MRVWVPLRPEDLAEAHAAGRVPAGQDRLTAPEDEESEYAALEEAARTSADLVRAGGGRRRRVVLVADLDEDPDAPVPWRRVAAVHVDTADDVPAGEDLAWFAPQEVPQLLEELAGPV